MKAEELKTIANQSVDEAKVKEVTERAFRQAIKKAQRGSFSSHLDLMEYHTDPAMRTTAAERAEIIRRIEEEGFQVQERIEQDGRATYTLHWGH